MAQTRSTPGKHLAGDQLSRIANWLRERERHTLPDHYVSFIDHNE